MSQDLFIYNWRLIHWQIQADPYQRVCFQIQHAHILFFVFARVSTWFGGWIYADFIPLSQTLVYPEGGNFIQLWYLEGGASGRGLVLWGMALECSSGERVGCKSWVGHNHPLCSLAYHGVLFLPILHHCCLYQRPNQWGLLITDLTLKLWTKKNLFFL